MRAVMLRAFGPPEVLEPAEVPAPEAGPGEVVIDVALAGVTFVETQIRSGRSPYPGLAPELPAILGNGVAGTVDGRRVMASLGGTGGYAEQAVARAQDLIDVPDAVALPDALAVLADGRTALLVHRAAQPRAGETVLVEAAAGGLGSLLVQLARAAGARVVALASGPKLDVARAVGAHEAFDVHDPDWPAKVGPVDVVYDGVGGDVGRAAFGLLRAGGRFSAFGMASGAFAGVDEAQAAARGVTLAPMQARTPEVRRAMAAEALGLVAVGELRPVLAPERPLEDAAGAHAAIEGRRVTGKTLLRVR